MTSGRAIVKFRVASGCAADCGTVVCKRTIGCGRGLAEDCDAAMCAANRARVVDEGGRICR